MDATRKSVDSSTDQERGNHDRPSGTQAGSLISTLLAISTATAFYVIGPIWLLRDTYIYHLFCGHGWVPYVSAFLFCFSFWQLILKIPLIKREAVAFELDLLPLDAAAIIDVADSQKILGRIHRLSANQQSLMLVVRIRHALLRAAQLGTAEKVDDVMRYRSEIDRSAMDASYAMPRFIIWAIPVLGFIGTVIGISNGVQSFSTLVQSASDIDSLRESLKGVTYGLGQAFETTMVALCMSLILMLIMSAIQRKEDDLLLKIDDYCMEHLLFKMRLPSLADQMLTHELNRMTNQLGQVVEAIRGVRSASES